MVLGVVSTWSGRLRMGLNQRVTKGVYTWLMTRRGSDLGSVKGYPIKG